MKTSIKTFVFLGIAILALGCAGPKIKEAVDALKPQIDELGTKVTEAKAIFEVVKGFEAKLGEKLSKDDIAKLATDIGNTKMAIGTVLSLEGELAPIADSLVILDKKAKGEAKTAIAGLNEQIAAVRASFEEFKSAVANLDALTAKLAELQKTPAKVTKAPAKKGRPKIEKKVK